MRVLLAVSAVLLLQACHDECHSSDFPVRCEGNTLVTCPTPGVDQIVPVRISRKDCGKNFCIGIDGGAEDGGFAAVCSVQQSPAPACAKGVSIACENPSTRLRCSYGFPTTRDACLACAVMEEDGGVNCVGGPYAACSSSEECASKACNAKNGMKGLCVIPLP